MQWMFSIYVFLLCLCLFKRLHKVALNTSTSAQQRSSVYAAKNTEHKCPNEILT